MAERTKIMDLICQSTTVGDSDPEVSHGLEDDAMRRYITWIADFPDEVLVGDRHVITALFKLLWLQNHKRWYS